MKVSPELFDDYVESIRLYGIAKRYILEHCGERCEKPCRNCLIVKLAELRESDSRTVV